MALLEVKLRPTGPWRIGHRSGDRERVETIYHSDALFSAVTQAMQSLGWLEEWLDATVRDGDAVPAVRFSSLFPFVGNTRLVTPPKTSWPPAAPSRLYLKGASLVPLEVALGSFDENRYAVDGESGCLIPGGASAPFQISVRSSVGVDRLTGSPSDAHRTACLQFHPRAGWWGLVDIENLQWETRVRSAFRLLADTGFGGERSRGWGRTSEPEFTGAAKLFPKPESTGAWWLLSMYSPHATDAVDWSRGEYSAQVRGGWVDSMAGTSRKKEVRLLEEGSVLAGPALRGRAVDVAPDGFAHPVYRAGWALAIPIALAGLQPVEPAPPEQRAAAVEAVPAVDAAPENAEDVAAPVVEDLAGEEPSAELLSAEASAAEPPSAEPASADPADYSDPEHAPGQETSE